MPEPPEPDCLTGYGSCRPFRDPPLLYPIAEPPLTARNGIMTPSARNACQIGSRTGNEKRFDVVRAGERFLRRSSRGAPAGFRCRTRPPRRTVISRGVEAYAALPTRRRASPLGVLTRPRNGVEVSGVRLMLRCEVVQNGKASCLLPQLRRQPVSALSSAFRATPVRNRGRQSRAAHFPSTLLPSDTPHPSGLRRPDMAGPDPRPNCAPSRDPHGQQNAHRRLSPGRNPGGGRPR